MKRVLTIVLSFLLLVTLIYLPDLGESAQAGSSYSPGFETFYLNQDASVEAKWDACKNKLTIEGVGEIEADYWRQLARKFDGRSYSYSGGKFISWGSSYFDMEIKPGVRLPSKNTFKQQGNNSSFYSGFFHGFKGRINLPSNLDTANLVTMRKMFALCGIKELDLTNWDTSKLSDVRDLFGPTGKKTSTKLARFELKRIPGSDNPNERKAQRNIENFQWPEFLTSYEVDILDEAGNVIETKGPYSPSSKYEYRNGDHVVARIVYTSGVRTKLDKLKYDFNEKTMSLKWKIENSDDMFSGFQILRGERPDNFKVIATLYDKQASSYTDKTAKTYKTYFYAVRPFFNDPDLGVYGKRSSYRSMYTVKMKKPKAYVKDKKIRLSIPKSTWLQEASGVEIRKRRYPNKKYHRIRTLTKLDKKRFYKDKESYHANSYRYWFRPYKLVNGKRIYGCGRTVKKKYYNRVSFKFKRYRTKPGVKLTWKGYKKADGYYIYKWNKRQKRYVRIKTLGKKKRSYYDRKLSRKTKARYRIHSYRIIKGKKIVSMKSTAPKPKINKHLSIYNQESRGGQKVKYIVIHYVGAVSSAENNCKYFARKNRRASAHFFVDSAIWQSIPLEKAAWHCGGGLQDLGRQFYRGNRGARFHGLCTNRNSIGIELCCNKINGQILPRRDAIDTSVALVRYLMRKYNVPAERVIRHYDVTGKWCPNGYIAADDWAKLHKKLTGVSGKSQL